jgi:hypothetical protein
MSGSGSSAVVPSAAGGPESESVPKRKPLDVVFDLRGIIAVLFTIYGIVCIIWGLAFTDSSELARSGGENVNLWAGVSMLVFAALMWTWAIAKPELPPAKPVAPAEAPD